MQSSVHMTPSCVEASKPFTVAIVDSDLTNSSQWTVANDVALELTIHLTSTNHGSEDDHPSGIKTNTDEALQCVFSTEDEEEAITAETCVLLRRPLSSVSSGDDSLLIRVDMNPESAFVIRGLSAISEARHLELYDSRRGGEYLTTIRGQPLLNEPADASDDEPDRVVYKTSANLNSNLESITIKFLIPKSLDTTWLYGLFLRVRRRSNHRPPPSGINSTLAELDKNGVQLSENAKRFMALLTAKSHAAGTTNTQLSATALATLMEKFNKSEEPTSDLKSTQNHSQEADGVDLTSSKLITLLASVLRSSLQGLEKRLWTRIDARLTSFETAQAAKLDRILAILERSNSSESSTDHRTVAKTIHTE